MGYQTPNIDKIAKEGVAFTDYYGQQSCTAGRAAFLGGNVPLADLWALSVYDVETRTLIKTPQRIAEFRSNVSKFKASQDGSIDFYFIPNAP